MDLFQQNPTHGKEDDLLTWKKTVAGILIALVACLGFAAYFFLAINPPALSYMETNLTEQIKRQLKEDSEDSLLISIQRPGTWHDLFTPEDWTFVVQYADASNPHFYQLDIDKEEFVETSSSQKNLA